MAEWELPPPPTRTPHSQYPALALTTIMFSITGEGIGKYVEVEFFGIKVVTWSKVE